MFQADVFTEEACRKTYIIKKLGQPLFKVFISPQLSSSCVFFNLKYILVEMFYTTASFIVEPVKHLSKGREEILIENGDVDAAHHPM